MFSGSANSFGQSTNSSEGLFGQIFIGTVWPIRQRDCSANLAEGLFGQFVIGTVMPANSSEGLFGQFVRGTVRPIRQRDCSANSSEGLFGQFVFVVERYRVDRPVDDVEKHESERKKLPRNFIDSSSLLFPFRVYDLRWLSFVAVLDNTDLQWRDTDRQLQTIFIYYLFFRLWNQKVQSI